MADILLNKIINNDIELEFVLNWLFNLEDESFEKMDLNTSPNDFVTYFLNFVHEQIPIKNNNSTQNNTPKRLDVPEASEKLIVKRRSSLFNYSNKNETSSNVEIQKSSSIPLNLNKSFENSAILENNYIGTPQKNSLSNYDMNNTYFSPVSPLYKRQDVFTTPKNRKCTEKANSLCLGDFIVTQKSSKKKNKTLNENRTRRITPTSLNEKNSDNNALRKLENSFNFQDLMQENEIEVKNVIPEETEKVFLTKITEDCSNVTPVKITSRSLNPAEDTSSKLEQVTYKKEIGHIVELYVFFLNNNFVLNITSEMYFLISLILTKQQYVKEKVVENENLYNSEIFESLHNIVYFGVKCLEKQIEVLKHYEKSTLTVLSETDVVRNFTPEFSVTLQKICAEKTDRVLEITNCDIHTNICFNLATDNRENFSSESSFQAFRKQRDLFYEILRIWENNHFMANWNFQVALGGKIKTLLSLGNDPINFVHFCRLFKSQLLKTSEKIQQEDSLEEDNILSSLSNINSEKLNKLQSRLVTKKVLSGLNSVPVFSGYQEFYRDFIVVASHHLFYRHLSDTFITEVLALNDSKLVNCDLKESGNEVATLERQAYLNCVKSMRVLAKFLGFMESQPYVSENKNFSENIFRMQLNVRKNVFPPFNIKQVLIDSSNQHKLILTIPWLIQYMAMLDNTTLKLPYYIEIHKMLFKIYRNLKIPQNSSFNSVLIKFSLGWLFELPHFPENEFFTNNQTILELNKDLTNDSLDNLNIVDQNILYVLCPFLEEIKTLLSSSALQRNSVTVKHITPVAAGRSNNDAAKKKLEIQLEEAFFNGQPISTRKTVEFVSERTASTCVKNICNSIVPSFKKECAENLKIILIETGGKWRGLEQAEQMQKLRSEATNFSKTCADTLTKKCTADSQKLIISKIPPAIENLLAVDTLEITKNTCVAVATRRCHDRVQEWVKSHVNPAIFSKDFESEIERNFWTNAEKTGKEKAVFMLPSAGKSVKHNGDSKSAAEILEELMDLSVNIIEENVKIDEEFVLKLLRRVKTTLGERNDVNELISSNICTICVDLLLLLITHRPVIVFDKSVLTEFADIWKFYFSKTSDMFKKLLCPRNVMLLGQSKNILESWECLSHFATFLIKNNLLDCDDFETQCTGIYQNEWDKGTLKNLSHFLNTFVKYHKQNGFEVNKFMLTVDFLSEFCCDL